jgi:hypothetical protein
MCSIFTSVSGGIFTLCGAFQKPADRSHVSEKLNFSMGLQRVCLPVQMGNLDPTQGADINDTVSNSSHFVVNQFLSATKIHER